MTPRRIALPCLAIAAAVFCTYIFFPFDKTKAVHRLLDKGMAAIEAEDLESLDKLISLYYKDSLGLTYASLRGNFSYLFREFENLAISRTTGEIVVGKDTCIANTGLWIRGTWRGNPSDLLGSENRHEPVVIYCIREFLRWKVIGTAWPERKPGIPEL